VSRKQKMTQEKRAAIERHLFAEQPALKHQEAAIQASISIISTIRTVLKYKLEHIFYHTTSVQRLQETHKVQRQLICQCLLDQD